MGLVTTGTFRFKKRITLSIRCGSSRNKHNGKRAKTPISKFSKHLTTRYFHVKNCKSTAKKTLFDGGKFRRITLFTDSFMTFLIGFTLI
jgi:hypothetical protein